MATFRHGKGTNIFIDQYDFSNYFNDANSTSTVEVAETTAFGLDAKTYIVGELDGKMSLKGMFEHTASTGTDQYFATALQSATNQKVIVAHAGNSLGYKASMTQADTTTYDISSAVGSVVMASAEFQSNSGVDNGDILSSGSAISATANGTGVRNEIQAATTNGGVGFFSVPVNTRNGTIIIKIQHSSDNSTFADLITFTTVTSSEKISGRTLVATGTTVNQYLRVQYTVAGSTGSATPVVAFARR